MPKLLIHRHQGVGQIEAASGKLTVVTYDIGEYQDIISAASHDDPHATIEGLKSFEGAIATRDGSMLPFEPALALHLGDGRRLNVLPTSNQGPGAEVRGSGGFY